MGLVMTSHRKRVRVWPEIWNHLKTTDQKLEVKLRSKSARFMYTKSLTHYIQLSTFTTLNDFCIFMHNSKSRKRSVPGLYAIKISVDESQNDRCPKRPLYGIITYTWLYNLYLTDRFTKMTIISKIEQQSF